MDLYFYGYDKNEKTVKEQTASVAATEKTYKRVSAESRKDFPFLSKRKLLKTEVGRVLTPLLETGILVLYVSEVQDKKAAEAAFRDFFNQRYKAASDEARQWKEYMDALTQE